MIEISLRTIGRVLLAGLLLVSAAPHWHMQAAPGEMPSHEISDHGHHDHHDHIGDDLLAAPDESDIAHYFYDHKMADHTHDQPCPTAGFAHTFSARLAVWARPPGDGLNDKVRSRLDRPPRGFGAV